MIKKDVIDHFNGLVNLSRVLGVTHSAVSQWGEIIPERHALRIERMTGGALIYDESLYRDCADTTDTNH